MHCATLCCKAAPKDTESKLIISDVGSSSNCLCYQDINHWEVKSCHRNGWSLSQQSVVSSLSLQQKLLSWIPPIKTFKIENGISLSKLFWPTVRKKCSSDWKKLFEIWGLRPKICKIFEITRTIYSNSERSKQFLVTKCFFLLF